MENTEHWHCLPAVCWTSIVLLSASLVMMGSSQPVSPSRDPKLRQSMRPVFSGDSAFSMKCWLGIIITLAGHEKYGEWGGPGDNCYNGVFKLVIMWRAASQGMKCRTAWPDRGVGWESELWISRDNSTLSDFSLPLTPTQTTSCLSSFDIFLLSLLENI